MIRPLLLALILLCGLSAFEVEERRNEEDERELPVIFAAPPPCPTGWSLNDNGNSTISYCYIQPDQGLPWLAARSYCQSIGGQLVSFYNRSEYDIVKNLLKPSIFLTWTGLYKNTTWKWSDGTTSAYATYWLSGEPKLNAGNCSAWRTTAPDGFMAASCEKAQPFVCKQRAAICPPYTSSGTVYTGTIQSPNYPNEYDNNLDCFYFIRAPNGTFVYIDFNPFDVETTHDYVTLYDGNDTSAPIIQSKVSGNYSYRLHFESNFNAMTVWFHTDSTVVRKGFKGTWKALAIPAIIYVNGSANGEVQSDGYPQNYSVNTNQEYYFYTDPNFHVNITFDDFITETRYDYVLIFDGPYVNGSSPLIANLTGNLTMPGLPPLNFLSTDNTLTMKFIADYIIVKKGWHLWYNFA